MREILAERIKEQRIIKGNTQEDIAKLLDISRANYGYYENGKNLPPIDKVLTLANYFKVTLDYLAGNERTATRLKISDALKQIALVLEDIEK